MRQHMIKHTRKFMAPLRKFDDYVLRTHQQQASALTTHDHELAVINHAQEIRDSTTASRGAISALVKAISWRHRTSLSQAADPTQSSGVKDYLRSVEKSFPDTPRKRRLPFTIDHRDGAIRLIDEDVRRGIPHALRLRTLMIMDSAIGSRISELIALRRADILLLPE
jgi:integrase